MENCKLSREFDISEHLLKLELSKVLEKEKSDMKIIENNRKRFWIKHKRLKNLKDTASSKEVNEYMQSLKTKNELSTYEKTWYEAIRCMIFTNGEVDLDKILCLHLLSVHAVEPVDNEYSLPSTSTLSATSCNNEEKNEEYMESPWYSVLPYYVVEIKQDEEQELKEKVIRNIDLCGTEDFLHILTPKALDNISLRSASIYDNFLKAAKERGEMLENQRTVTLQEKAYASGIKAKFKNLAKNPFLPKVSLSLSTNFPSCSTSVNLPAQNVPIPILKKAHKNCIYLRPVETINDVHRKKVKVVIVCINKELSTLVQSVMEVLENVSPDKIKKVIKILNEPKKLANVMAQNHICKFVQYINEFSLISSPKNFATKCMFAFEEPDFNSKARLRKHVIAETLEVEPNPFLEELIIGIRKSISKFIEVQEKDIESKNFSPTEEKVISPRFRKEFIDNLSENDNSSLPSTSRDSDNKFDDSKNRGKINKEYIMYSSEKNKKNTRSKSLNQNKSKWHVEQENNVANSDLIVLRRMTNEQRILVGQRCASLKTKKINNEGVWTEKVPLPDLMAPVLPQESINYLTQGTVYAKNIDNDYDKIQNIKENQKTAHEKLTELILSELRCEIAEVETQKKLANFMDKTL